MRVEIVEVGPRDGLQNEKQNLGRQAKSDFITQLTRTGLKRIEVGAFVNPKKIPQMADSKELITKIIQDQKNERLPTGIRFSALVPNERGMIDALGSGISEVAIFTAVSETFCEKNINCSVDESFERFEPVIEIAKRAKIKVRAYLSTCFGCPYEGEVKEARMLKLVDRLMKLNVYEVSVGDTIGAANPKQVRSA